MLLREAIKRIDSLQWNEGRQVALVTSFEPLYVATYLQAFLAERFPEATPRVVHWGYDRLEEALTQTSTFLKDSAALFFLSWEDLHPGLSWRSRGNFFGLTGEEIKRSTEQLEHRLAEWLSIRQGSETYVVPPSWEWLPLLDPSHPLALGPLRLQAISSLTGLMQKLASLGTRVMAVGPLPIDYRQWLFSGCPLKLEEAEQITRRFVELAYPVRGRTKAIVTDLDGTLWKGAVGEDGLDGIVCGPDSEGHPYYVFQKFLLKQQKAGILLAFCSKNDPDASLAFEVREMPLQLSHFSTHRCNWESKVENLYAISQELQIGFPEMVMIDDNSAEVAEIQRDIPQLRIYRTPQTGSGWLDLMRQLQGDCGTWQVRTEDKLRSDVGTFRQRNETMRDLHASRPVPTLGDLSYLKNLHLEVTICQDAFRDSRSLELINKTNQFHLDGERIAPDEWRRWSMLPETFCWSARLKDNVGEFGTIAVVTGRRNGSLEIHFRAFALSCRAFGRGVETLLLAQLGELGPWEWICGPFRETGRNEPLRRFLIQQGADLSLPTWRISRKRIKEAADAVVSQTGAQLAVSRVDLRPLKVSF